MLEREIYIHKYENDLIDKLNNKLISEEYKNQLINYYKDFEEEMLISDLIGKSLEVNDKQFSEVFNIIKKQADILEIKLPKVYICNNSIYEIKAKGYDKPWIEISSKALEDFTTKEIEFDIAREMCHIKEEHIKYEILYTEFLKAIETLGKIGDNLLSSLPGIISSEGLEVYSASFKLVAYQWSRIAEYTADRCAYLICKDIKSGISTIKKHFLNSKIFSDKINMESFLKQCDFINNIDSSISRYSIFDEKMPYSAFRIRELIAFASNFKTKEYFKDKKFTINK